MTNKTRQIACVLLVTLAASTCAIHRHQWQQRLMQEFPTAGPSGSVFADDRFAIKPFLDGGALAELEVVPREWLLNQEGGPGNPPTLTPVEFESLLTRISRIQQVGRLVERGEVGLAGNRSTSFVDDYENAIVGRSLWNRQLMSFRVVYFRPVTGRLENVPRVSPESGARHIWVRISGKAYWVSAADLEKAKVGTRVTIRAAGPADR
jgi:hypothetical protein